MLLGVGQRIAVVSHYQTTKLQGTQVEEKFTVVCAEDLWVLLLNTHKAFVDVVSSNAFDDGCQRTHRKKECVSE